MFWADIEKELRLYQYAGSKQEEFVKNKVRVNLVTN